MIENYYVYIVTTTHNKMLYIGVTNDLRRRIKEHKSEEIDGFTKKYHIHKLVYFEKYSDPETAIEREKQLKKWTRNKKNDLVTLYNPRWEDQSDSFIL